MGNTAPLDKCIVGHLDRLQESLGGHLQLLGKTSSKIWVVLSQLITDLQPPIPNSVSLLWGLCVLDGEVEGGNLVTSTAKLEEDRIERSCHRRKFSATERGSTILLHLQTLSFLSVARLNERKCCRVWESRF